MMKNDDNRTGICPRCGNKYVGRPALSRIDNETPICPDCGTREALEIIGVPKEEQERILRTIHEHTGRGRRNESSGKNL